MAQTIIEQFSGILSGFIKTLALDNDKAYAKHQKIGRKLKADTYFTRPMPPRIKAP